MYVDFRGRGTEKETNENGHRSAVENLVRRLVEFLGFFPHGKVIFQDSVNLTRPTMWVCGNNPKMIDVRVNKLVSNLAYIVGHLSNYFIQRETCQGHAI